MKTPKSIDVDITSRCNLHCKYCFHRTSPADTGREISASEWTKFFEECGNAGVMTITIGGGEPFIKKDLPDIIRGIVANRMRFVLLSNGGLITPEIANFIASTGRCDYVQISIDGSCAAVHDRFRGTGAFDGAIRGITILKEAGAPVTSRITIHRYNLDDLENAVHLLLDEINMGVISTNSVSNQGLARENEEEVSLTPAETCIAMEKIIELAKLYNNRITATAGPLSQGREFQEMERARLDGRTIPGRGFLSGCGCMWNKMAVRPDGTYVPCGMLSHIELGKINQDRLLDIWQNHPEFTRLRQRYTIPLSKFPDCIDCGYQMVCTGNCPADGYSSTGDVYVPSPNGCLKKFLTDGGRIVSIPE
ncbi:SynChlorMet cassette radical SAM/SPASM protein ScmE [Methanospirillum sp.]|uniref:SynChlorMet cassette radical SAM/SPASM protein ScmE n=1 Tax=Methanospirillum sp. TaxID=45200 RepID=UPI0026142EBC|nr:SynChlorMet cassette radical SAM/SPASM protein ScmE [Methanospirillum sp.]